jgi:hypothetical protein
MSSFYKKRLSGNQNPEKLGSLALTLTQFFHTSTIIRRRSNAIYFLKTSASGWLSDRAAIGGNFVDHFSNLFSSSSPPIDDELSDLFPPIISEEENLALVSIPTEEEVFKVLSSIDSSKAPGPDGFFALFYKKILECCQV